MGHWYTQSGEPCHFVEKKDGTMRDATLRDARKLGLVPGFSGVASVLAKPGLDAWKENQLLEAALNCTYNEAFADEDDWKKTVKTLARERSNEARDKGLAVHDAIEEYIKRGLHSDFPFEYEPYIVGVGEALKEALSLDLRALEAETTFACGLGYGGMIDALSRSPAVLLDWKTKDKEFDDKTKLAYPEHGMQLAAYRYGVDMYDAVCVNVFISPSANVRIHVWEEDELRKLWRKFNLCLKLWKEDRDYDSFFKV